MEKLTPDGPPLVSVILPIRNEVHTISRCLSSVLAQDYPREKIEILVVDGMSDDGTRAVVSGFAALDSRLVMLDNPSHIVPPALNLGIQGARGEIIIRVDGHAIVAPDYVRKCVEVLKRVNADCAGGAIETVGETWVGRGIALAQSSPFGVGNAAFRYAKRPQFVDTLAFGAYRRDIFGRVGMFDEELVRSQDDEFNFRLLLAGGRIWLDPEIHSTYFSRSTLRALWEQYYGYGFWKVRVIQKHKRPASWRHLVPAAFVVALVCSAAISLVSGSAAWILAIATPYLLASVGVSLWQSMRKDWRCAPVLPVAFAVMHLAYGSGFLIGVSRCSLLALADVFSQE